MQVGFTEITKVSVVWHDAKTLTVEGRGYADTDGFYQRWPARAKAKLNSDVWGGSDRTAGMVVRFVTDSTDISAKWTLSNSELDLPNLAAIGMSGLDLYVRYEGKWRWLGIGKPLAMENEATLVSELPAGKREFALYLPLYNGLKLLQIGIREGTTIEPAGPRPRNLKPVVFYGSSITQGASASRPGMAYASIIGRRLDIPIINLGFSGVGKCEPEVADLLAELDPQIYVIDCMPNMYASDVNGRLRYLLKILKEHHPNTPVVLVADPIYQNAYAFPKGTNVEKTDPVRAMNRNATLKKIYEDNLPEWNGKLFYVPSPQLFGDDSEATVDGYHPSDLGLVRMADTLTPMVERALAVSEK